MGNSLAHVQWAGRDLEGAAKQVAEGHARITLEAVGCDSGSLYAVVSVKLCCGRAPCKGS